MSVQSSRKIGYALGGGAARGLSHIGVLKVLDGYGIFPDIIAATSMGAVIGALYAGGLKVGDIEQLALRLDWKRLALLADVTLSLSGLIQGRRVISLLKSIIGDLSFSQLKCDFACVATDIITGEQVVLRDGSLIEAVRASISIPGIFTPVNIEGRYLVDGGLTSEVPVSVCREMGAEYVIGVNVIPEPSTRILGSKKYRKDNHFESPKLGETKDERKLTILSNEHSGSLRSRLDNIEKALKTFLLYHQPREQRKLLKSTESVRMDKPKRLPPKAPSLIDVLSQSITIAEYKIAIENLKDADLAISPDIEDIGSWQFNKAAQAISAGEKAASRVLLRSKPTSVISQFRP